MTHSLKELARECTRLDATFNQLTREAKKLDMFYIPTRCPNGLSGDLAPAEFYEEEDSKACISSAGLILQTVKSLLNQ
jgi:HEPN domain-containing protein